MGPTVLESLIRSLTFSCKHLLPKQLLFVEKQPNFFLSFQTLLNFCSPVIDRSSLNETKWFISCSKADSEIFHCHWAHCLNFSTRVLLHVCTSITCTYNYLSLSCLLIQKAELNIITGIRTRGLQLNYWALEVDAVLQLLCPLETVAFGNFPSDA